MIFSEIIKKYPKEFYKNTLFTILNKVFDLAPPFLIGIAVDIVVKKEGSLIAQYGVVDAWEQLLLVAVLTVIVWVLESIFEYYMAVGWKSLSQVFQHDLRDQAFSHTLNLDLVQVEDRSSGELMSILNDDINQLEQFLNIGAFSIIQLAVTISVIGGAFFYLAPNVAVYGVLPIPLIILGSLKFQKFLKPKYKKVREHVGLLNSEFSNSIQGIHTVKAFANEHLESEKINTYSKAYMSANFSAIKISSLFTPLIRMLILMGFLVNLLYGGYLCLNGELEVGTYSVLIFMIQRLLWPLTTLGNMLDLYQRSSASMYRVLKLIKTQYEIKSGEKSFPKKVDIEFKDLTFSYPNREDIFTDLTMTFPDQKTIGLVGGTGSGKSTLVKIMLRFYDIKKGSVSIGGEDIRQLDLKSLRSNIGYVGQDVYLFHGTIKDNIVYGNGSLSDDKIYEIAKLAEAHDFILNLPDGYNTIVGERGHRLSGGQRQRISIARALIKSPPILILDEATSAVDNETEAMIQKSLSKVKKGRTTIVIAHRLSTIVEADLIYVLDAGKVVQTGTHDQLIKTSGTYQDLWSVQTGIRSL